ncbi:MAG TPA: hypothetical protein DCZ03_07730 [Gammaproteobacteria bacterium]|nr:hypothetical protein [Gammaproteobacteria bacterium]
MHRFYCDCGQEIFLESTICVNCRRPVAYFPIRNTMVTLEQKDGDWCVAGEEVSVQWCTHRLQYEVCNSVLHHQEDSTYCVICRLNRTVPNLNNPRNLTRWAKLEEAKRRLLFGLLALGLPLEVPVDGGIYRLGFDFLEDKRTNPSVPDEFITTGHQQGIITVNVLEADDVQRVWQREQSGERYRTLLGHLRHEVGHFYFELLATDRTKFQALFGAETQDYDDALRAYYLHGAKPDWEQHYISAYASVHPKEDWAECFAHYLHMLDTLQTAAARDLIEPFSGGESAQQLLQIWDALSVTLNELNRSLGMPDAYPFVVNAEVANKLEYIHQAIQG